MDYDVTEGLVALPAHHPVSATLQLTKFVCRHAGGYPQPGQRCVLRQQLLPEGTAGVLAASLLLTCSFSPFLFLFHLLLLVALNFPSPSLVMLVCFLPALGYRKALYQCCVREALW